MTGFWARLAAAVAIGAAVAGSVVVMSATAAAGAVHRQAGVAAAQPTPLTITFTPQRQPARPTPRK